METLQEQPVPQPQLDERGYMTEPKTWTPEVAESLAHEQGISTLTDDQWKVIIHIRQYYLEFGIVPRFASFRGRLVSH